MGIIELSLVLVAGLFVAAVLFCGWIVVSIGRGLGRLFASVFAPIVLPKRPALSSSSNNQRCTNNQCACDNPSHARFCRRCGKSLPNLLRIVSSRAAML